MRATLYSPFPTRGMENNQTTPARLKQSVDAPWTAETWAAARADSQWADERWAAEMRERFERYPLLLPEQEIRLAMDILYDVLHTWDHDTLAHYPEGMPCFDQFLDEIGDKLYDIRWNHHGNAA